MPPLPRWLALGLVAMVLAVPASSPSQAKSAGIGMKCSGSGRWCARRVKQTRRRRRGPAAPREVIQVVRLAPRAARARELRMEQP